MSENINWYPGHMEKTKEALKNEYKNIDIVYELVDSRIPRSSKITNIYDIIGFKPKILIMTKKDLTDQVFVENWVKYYEHTGTTVVLADLHNQDDIKKIVDCTNEKMESLQEGREQKGMKPKQIRALVIGIPNVGKSTLINQMVGKKVAKVENRPGVTKHLTWLKTNYNIALLDTPGLLWPKMDNQEVALNLASFFSIPPNVIDDINSVGVHILNKLNKYYPNILKERYGIDANPEGLNFDEVYETLAKKMGAIQGNDIDYEKVSNRIVNDIKDGYITGVIFDHEI